MHRIMHSKPSTGARRHHGLSIYIWKVAESQLEFHGSMVHLPTPGLYKENMCKSGQMASERHFRLDNIICIHSRHFCELYCVYLHLVELQLCMRSKRYTLPQLYGNFCSEQLIRA